MFTVTANGDNRIDIALDGKLDATSMEAALDDLTRLSEAVENGKMLYQITGFQLPTLGAIGIELSRMPALFGLIRKFDKVAVLCDAAWIKTASEWEGMLIPGLDIKAFDFAEKAAAETWLAS